MNTAELAVSRQFVDAMGPMVSDEKIVRKVILYINSLRHEEDVLPTMSFEELDSCIPLEQAFRKLRDDVTEHYKASER